MRTHDALRDQYAELTKEYAAWLEAEDRRRAEEYRSGLARSEPDGPIFEACTWRLLTYWGVEIHAEDPRRRAPDFRCRVGGGAPFFVEATARQRDVLGKEVGLADVILPKGGAVNPSHSYHGKIWDKADQATSRAGSPVLVAYGSLHIWAPDLLLDCHLLDEALGLKSSVWVGGPEEGKVERLHCGNGAFTGHPMFAGLLFVSTEAAAPVLRPWAMEYRPVRGVLNPEAAFPFDAGQLPHVAWLSADDA